MNKNRNKILLVVILFYILIILVQNAYFFLKIQELTSTKDITAKASGTVTICINRQPSLNNTCNLTASQDILYSCQVNATDPDGHGVNFTSTFITGTELFNISSEGLISFTANQSYVGNYTLTITVSDILGCDNSYDSDNYNLTVINVNDPPYLIQPVPNQSWSQDTSLSPFDLDNYFADPDNDPLTYTYTLLSNIQVIIDADNEVLFTPIAGWSGTEYVIFYAWDPYFANASSNNIQLEVVQTSTPAEETPISGSRGGGGGGGAVPSCIPRWYCRPWGKCEPDNLMRRECYDLNNCSSTFGIPNITQYCEFEHTCYDGIKAPNEEGIDCGGPCPPCGTCYDNICNNKEDCTLGLTVVPDCGGPCHSCIYIQDETCYDSICNNNEDCVFGLSFIPDCGGPCELCPVEEKPVAVSRFRWGLFFLFLLVLILIAYTLVKSYPQLKKFIAKKKRKLYEERLLLEAKISESILENLSKIETLIGKEDIQKIIILFSSLVRRYFKNLLDMSYEFTYHELTEEINSRNISPTFKKVLTKFFDRSLEIEFSGRSVSQEEMRAMISEFKEILSLTSSEPLAEEEVHKKSKKSLAKVDKMFVSIAEAESYLRRGQINKAYYRYLKLHADFNNLSVKDKNKIHSFISRLYDEIKLAREELNISK